MEENQNYFDNINHALPAPHSPREEKGGSKGVFWAGLVSGVAISLLVAAGMFAGRGIKGVIEQSRGGGSSDGSAGDTALNEGAVAKIKALEEAIDKYFYLHEVTDEELQDGLYRGLLTALDDPYSEYYTAEELSSMMEHSKGIYYGIGAYVQLDTNAGIPKISGVIEGSPAEEAALRAEDLIYEVDGVSTYGLSLTEAVSMIKGPEGTNVELTLVREGESDYVKVTLTRRRVESPTVKFVMLDDWMAHIQITEFGDVTVDQFAEALATAKEYGAKGLILDLRGNPGGNLSAVVDICNMILPRGMIVYTEDKAGKREEYKSDGKHELNMPLVVLVDTNSASAAEIMAGAIKDYGIGVLVGTTTFGKGIVQQIIPLQDGSAIKLTISAYYTPNGNNIHGIGIEPDVVCEFDSEAYYGSEERPDNQLEMAKEVLRGEMGK